MPFSSIENRLAMEDCVGGWRWPDHDGGWRWMKTCDGNTIKNENINLKSQITIIFS